MLDRARGAPARRSGRRPRRPRTTPSPGSAGSSPRRPGDGRGGDRHRLGVHDVGDGDARRGCSVNARLRDARARGGAEQPAQRDDQRPSNRVDERRTARARRRISSQPKPTRSGGEARRLVRSPVSFQAAARAIRPPSSGKAGTRLNTSRIRFIGTRNETRPPPACAGGAGEPRRVPERVRARERDRAPRASTISERHRGPGDGDAELGAGRVGVAAHLHHAAEQEEVDPVDLDALAPRGERVAELVSRIEPKTAQRRDHGAT